MDLFVINRYLGDSTDNNKKEKEGEQLNKLLQKIEERKKKKIEKHGPLENWVSGTQTSGELKTEFSEVKDIAQDSIEKSEKSLHFADDKLEKKDLGVDSFTVIATKTFTKKRAIKSVLPQWLANPEVIPTNLQELSTSVEDMSGLDKDLVDKLKKVNVTHFFPVQCKVIPHLLSELQKPVHYWPCDMCVSSPTGSGKTLAFVLPIVQALKTRVVRRVRALVVLPVQDLAAQVYEVFKYYCSGTDLRVLLATGKKQFKLEQKKLVRESVVNGFYSLVDILVTTPGRLVGHLQTTAGFSLKCLRFLVIDEADRVIDKVQSDWLFYLKKHIDEDRKDLPLSVATLQMFPRPPQKLLFSATLTQDPEKLHQLSLFQPKLFTSVIEGASGDCPSGEIRGSFLGKYTTPQELSEKYCIISESKKPVLLYHLIQANNWKHVLCFTDSQKISHRLCLLLHHLGQGEIVVTEISAALKQAERDLVLRRFVAGEIQVLVSTDALARGMDFQNVDCVISYGVPKFVKNYIHRVGRTGRAGRSGSAVTLLTESDRGNFIDMLRRAGKEIAELPVSGDNLSYLSECYQTAVDKLGHDIEGEKSNIIKFAKLQKVGRSYLQISAKNKKIKKYKTIVRNNHINKTDTSSVQHSSISSENMVHEGAFHNVQNSSKPVTKLCLRKQEVSKTITENHNILSAHVKVQTKKRKKKSKVINGKKQKLSE